MENIRQLVGEAADSAAVFDLPDRTVAGHVAGRHGPDHVHARLGLDEIGWLEADIQAVLAGVEPREGTSDKRAATGLDEVAHCSQILGAGPF
jgi:hypothetical protein